MHSGIQTKLIGSDKLAEGEFAPDVEVQLMRIIQEALTNVRKHAHAQHAQITFEVRDDRAQIAILDDGYGFDPAQAPLEDGRHFGLRVMRERAKEIKGIIRIQSAAGQGTKVIVNVPLHLGEEVTRNDTDESVVGR